MKLSEIELKIIYFKEMEKKELKRDSCGCFGGKPWSRG